MQYQKVFLIAVALTGILLVVFLSQLAKAGTIFGATVEKAVSEALPTDVPLALVPTIVRPTPTLAVLSTAPGPSTSDSAGSAIVAASLPTATPPPAMDQIASSHTLFHTVQAGETLVQIAEQFGSTVAAIIARNQLPSSGTINSGQLLIIPVLQTTPAAEPAGLIVNGLSLEAFIIMPPEVQEHVQAIYQRGMTLGRDPHSLSVIGDSTVEMLNFLTGFETLTYNLGEYGFLEPVLAHFAGSFSRPRFAVEQGIHSRQVFLEDFADPEYCEPGESMIDCEWRLHNPSVVLVRMGSNDGKPDLYDREMRRIVSYALERGTIPIIGTKADEFLDPGHTNNQTLRQIARDYRLPLWDFQLVAQTLPDNGLLSDRVHLTLFPEFDWTMPEAFRTGHGLQNLTALLALDAVLQTVAELSEYE
jgi:LysM repeat protein